MMALLLLLLLLLLIVVVDGDGYGGGDNGFDTTVLFRPIVHDFWKKLDRDGR
jgi:hypothetical protein